MAQTLLINNYQTGQCNIGSYEKKMRRRAGYFGMFLTLLGIIGILSFNLDPIYSLGLFFPIYFSVIGFYQDKANFCVAFGFNGIYNMEKDLREIKKIQNDIQRKMDRIKAIKMSFIAFLISFGLTISIYGVNKLI
ncbi:MAG: hypothetical protein ACXAC7_16790 [Candidatus Hodarchaeales archaeon]|jgi:hypothetical protein